jgi:hypothetical protein
LLRALEAFKKIEMGIQSKAEPMMRPTIDRIPKKRVLRAIINDTIATDLLAEMAKRSWRAK